MGDQDLTLTFDPKMFMGAIDQIVGKLTGIESQLGKVGNTTSSMQKKGAKSIGIWTAVATKALGLLGQAISAVMNQIPEIGHSFKIAGDIISRNLFWPLRRELIPLLQGMLNWVRDHRAMFLRWGMVIANVFRVVFSVIKSGWEILSKLIKRFADGVKKIFGGTVKSVTELLNLLLFKAAVIITGVQVLLEPFLTKLVDVFVVLVKYGKAFFDGFMRGVSGISEPIGDLIVAFQDLFDALSELFGGGESSQILAFFKSIGHILGFVIKTAVEAILVAIRGIIAAVKGASVIIDYLMGKITKEQMKVEFGEIGSEFAGHAKKSFGRTVDSAKKMGSDIKQDFKDAAAEEAMKKAVQVKTGVPAGKTETYHDNKKIDIHVDSVKKAGEVYREVQDSRSRSGATTNQRQATAR